ncbi:hypothetical protein GGF38_001321, partial [Coemansia sp. RSA 25]
MRYRSPQAQLVVVMAFVVVLLCVPNVATPSAVARLVATQAAVREYRASWRSQLVTGVSGLLGIAAINAGGPRLVMLLGSACGTAYSASIIASHYHRAGGGGAGWYVASAVVEDFGHTVLTVGLVTVLLTYPREQRKARTLALFQFLVNLSLTLGEAVPWPSGKAAAWTRMAACVAALGVAPWMTPVARVIRDSGVYVVAEGHAPPLSGELHGLARCLWSWDMALVVPYMFANPFALGTLGISFPDRSAVLLYNGGSLAGVVALGILLDIGSACRRRRGVYGFAVTCMLMIACTVSMAMFHTPRGGEGQTRWYGGTLFYFSVAVSGMAVSCVFLFSGWVIGSLTNDAWVTARLVGVNMLVVPGMGSLAADAACRASRMSSLLPLCVGAGVAALASAAMFVVVRRISDTNTWELASVRPPRPENRRSAPETVH